MKDYYYILGVSENASEQEIKSAYRKLSLKFHPDKNNGEKYFEERFKEIQEGYETLSNPVKRTEYNYKLNKFKSSRTNQDNLKEEEIKRKFEEELRRREEEIKRNYQDREKKIKDDFAKRERDDYIKQNSTPKIHTQSTNKFILFLLSIGLIIIIYFVITKNNSTSKSEIIFQSSSEDYTNILYNLTQEWNKAHSTKDVAALSNLYANSILLYGKDMDKNNCISNKLSLFKKYPDFSQQIVGDILVEKINETQMKCSFLKRVTINQNTNDYPSYLVFSQTEGNWRVEIEGDLITDQNLLKKKERINNFSNNSIKGDFDGDGKHEYATLVPPKIPQLQTEYNIEECISECNCYIIFSNKNITSIKIENCISGNPVNEGDLNDDGVDEIGILPGWWIGCWRRYEVYTFTKGSWKFVIEPFLTHCNQWDNGVDVIEKDLSIKGNVIIRYSEHTGTEIVTKLKSIPSEK